jgi:hypothetical protein
VTPSCSCEAPIAAVTASSSSPIDPDPPSFVSAYKVGSNRSSYFGSGGVFSSGMRTLCQQTVAQSLRRVNVVRREPCGQLLSNSDHSSETRPIAGSRGASRSGRRLSAFLGSAFLTGSGELSASSNSSGRGSCGEICHWEGATAPTCSGVPKVARGTAPCSSCPALSPTSSGP